MAVSVVTGCMNRNDHLAQTIRQWLARDWVDQVVVVDWSSKIPVAETLRDVRSDKITIIRAEGEDCWVLSYAYNLGIVHATGDAILKVDADCLVGDRLFIDCCPGESVFYAGDFLTAVPRGKTASVNGQCFFTRGAFEAVNGFSELIRGWGEDDKDFYRRLQAQGLSRLEIDCDLLDFIEHPPEERFAHTPRPVHPRPGRQLLEQQLTVQDVKNRVVAALMPWGRWFPRARYRRLSAEASVVRVERLRDLEIKIPPAVLDRANLLAGQNALKELRIAGHDDVPDDYPAVVDLWEQWVIRNLMTPEAAAAAWQTRSRQG